MSSYRYTDHGAGYPMPASYHDNTGYYGSGKDVSRKGSQRLEAPSSFEPVRTYPSQMVVSAKQESFNWHMLRTAVAAVFFCPLCGLFGLVYAILSYVDFHKGNTRGYSSKKNCALGWSVTGIVLGVMGILCAIITVLVVIVRILP